MEHSLQRLNAVQRIQLWAERIEECRGSGMSIRGWCRENEISEKAYYYWQRRLYQQMVSAAECVDFAEIPGGYKQSRALVQQQNYACLAQQLMYTLEQTHR